MNVCPTGKGNLALPMWEFVTRNVTNVPDLLQPTVGHARLIHTGNMAFAHVMLTSQEMTVCPTQGSAIVSASEVATDLVLLTAWSV